MATIWTPRSCWCRGPAPGAWLLAFCPDPWLEWRWPPWTIHCSSQVSVFGITVVEYVLHLHPGGMDGYVRDEILEFHPDTEEWSLAGRMLEAKASHTVSTINFEDVREHCIM